MSANESVRVMVRFRPSNDSERAKANSLEPWRSLQNSKQSHIKMNGQELRLTNIETHGDHVSFRSKEHKFYFDSLMPENTTQIEAFNKVALKTCDEIIQGYNGTIFVYGQSGSGKTHTMYGPEDEKDSDDIEAMGIIPQSCAYIFGVLNNKNHKLVQGMQSYVVQCEFIEIYNEMLRDLLNINSEVKIRQRLVNRKTDEWVVDVLNVERRQVSNLSEVLRCIREASKNRTVAGTNLNATSSRSHMVMRLFVRITTDAGVRTGIANFSDLAGSEKVKKTGATGDRLEEAKSILLSLSTLGRVIDALTTDKHPPFQESKLTFLLKDSLGGNCKTTLLIAASPHVFNRDETVWSLRFGETCRKIQNKAKITILKTRSQLLAENEELKQQIAALKRGVRIPNASAGTAAAADADADADDEKHLSDFQLERAKYESRIKELEQLNERYCEQMKQSQSKESELDELNGKYSQLEHDLQSKNEQSAALQQQLQELQTTQQSLQQQNEQFAERNKALSATGQQLATDKQRLQHSHEQQSQELGALREQFDATQRAQTELQQKWKTELDSKKSQFSQQEMELSRQIEQLQLQSAQDRETQAAQKRELAQTRTHVEQVTSELHSVQDEHLQLQNAINEEREQLAVVRTENEQLQSHLQQAKLSKATVELQKNEYRSEVQTQVEKMNALEYEYEQQSQQLRQTQKRVKDVEKEHKLELQRIRAKMQAIVELNEQLQQENKVAIEVLDDHQATISKHKRQLTDISVEKQVVVKQNERLQTYYNQVVQQQIEKDSQLAHEWQMQERERWQTQMSQRAKGPRGIHNRSTDSDGDEDELLPGSGGVTAGGPMPDYQAQIMRMKLDESNETEVPASNHNSKNKKKQALVEADEKSNESDSDGGDDEDDEEEEFMDLEEEQNAMFSKANKWKRESAILRKQQKEQQVQEMQTQSREEIEAKMQEFERQRQGIAAQYDSDRALAQQMHASQLDKHRHSWNQYGMPRLNELEQEHLRKQKEWEERRRKFIDENFVAADKIPTHTPLPLSQDDVDDGAEKKRRKRKNNDNAAADDDDQRLIDPSDGMGKIVIFDPTLDDEYDVD